MKNVVLCMVNNDEVNKKYTFLDFLQNGKLFILKYCTICIVGLIFFFN